MKLSQSLMFLLAMAALPAFADEGEAAISVIQALGSINGQALACAELSAAGRAKSLMLAHGPKTTRFGIAFDEATQAAYLAQTRDGGVCPAGLVLTDKLNQLAPQLDALLPIAVEK